MVDVKQVADAADMIVNGYAFTRCTEFLCFEFEPSRPCSSVFRQW